MENQVAIIDEAHLNAEDSGFGLVYLLKRRINSSIIKIGYTSRTAESRATNYTDGEWIVHKEYPMPVWLARMTERGAHLKLERFWLDPKLTGGSASEIFTCSIEDADIAIQISYIDQLEKSLRHLGIPSSITKIIIKERGLSSDISSSTIEKHLATISGEQKSKVENLNAQLRKNLDELELEKEKLQLMQKLHDAECKSLHEKISQLETDVSTLKSVIHTSTLDFNKEISILENISEKKINTKDFEMLRDGFRRAIGVMRHLRLKD